MCWKYPLLSCLLFCSLPEFSMKRTLIHREGEFGALELREEHQEMYQGVETQLYSELGLGVARPFDQKAGEMN